MTWVLKYNAPKGQRVNRYFWGVTNFSGLWFEDESKTWTKEVKGSFSSHDHSVKTTKAFKRYLRNHPELKGAEVILVNNFMGYNDESLNITATWEERK